jgi:sterol desaturase/sphingolipid hydroxylase (fatty acid hydroxylase superfamily)
VDAALASLEAAYGDPRFLWVVLGGNAVSVGTFAVFAGALTLLAWADPAWARPWKVQDKPFKFRRFAGVATARWLGNSAAMLAVAVLGWPVLQHTGLHVGAPPPVWKAALQLLLFLVVDDALFYFMHRTLHRGWLWKHIHKVHHQVVTPFALTGHHMHVVEYMAIGSLMLVGPALLGVHVWVLFAWIALRQWEAAEGHCGYRIPFSPTVWLPGFDGPDHHDFHHSRFHGNYAGYLPHMDRWLDTMSRGYAEHTEAR